MIISDVKSGIFAGKRRFYVLITGLIAVLLMAICFFYSRLTTPEFPPGTYFCDAEEIDGDQFLGSNAKFSGAKTQSADFAFSGRYSSKTPKSDQPQYGFGVQLNPFSKGETYRASVWQFRPEGGGGTLVVSGDGEGEFYRGVDIPVETRNGWERLEMTFKIPTFRSLDKVSVYVYSDGKEDLYFDDLKVEKITESPLAPEFATIKTLELTIEDKGMRKLERKRSEALRAGILETTDDDWVKGKLTDNETEERIKVDIRLKGDWLDHLEGEKWSFRVKTKGGEVWNRMRAFSLHTPKARAFLHEWALHELWAQEDVLTTRYDFVLLKLNGKELGVYAYEEHFDKILVERQKRREGPVVRFSEDAFWSGIKRHMQNLKDVDHGLEQPVKEMEAAEINTFQEKKVLNSPLLKQQYEIAQNLLYQYKYGSQPAEDIFDLERVAKYYAICDVMDAYHGTAWHNQRFYYNPVIAKLEPIGFDGYSKGPAHRNNFLGAGAYNEKRIKSGKVENLLFLNKTFTAHYAFYLEKYSARTFMQDFLAEIEEGLKIREELIQSEFPDYSFNREDLVIYAQRMHLVVLPFNNHSLKAYTEQNSAKGKALKVAGFHGLPLEVIGSGPTAEAMTDTLQHPVLLEAFRSRQIQEIFKKGLQKDSAVQITKGNIWKAYTDQDVITYSSIHVGDYDKYLFFKVLGIDSVFYSEILDWPSPKDFSPPQKLRKIDELSSNELFEVLGQQVLFKKGKHTIYQDIIIPEKYRVTFPEGVELDLVKGAKFISYAPVFMRGNEEAPVKIHSSDGTGNGFTILQTKEESQLEYVIFDNLNTLDDQGWTLTGAVTFYEADVSFNHCVFRNNRCEDALNVIRSEFSLNNSLISNAFSDGLDADFSKGYINNCRFQKTINDAMDFSGSNILIENCVVDDAGDKGVSVGEDTDASIFSIRISNSNIGVASKDLSVLTIQSIDMYNCRQGFAAYQKKPEYGGSTIIVKDFKAELVDRLHTIQEGSVLQLQSKIIKGE